MTFVRFVDGYWGIGSAKYEYTMTALNLRSLLDGAIGHIFRSENPYDPLDTERFDWVHLRRLSLAKVPGNDTWIVSGLEQMQSEFTGPTLRGAIDKGMAYSHADTPKKGPTT